MVLKRLLSALRAAEICMKCLSADKGFCCIPVLRYHKRQPIAASVALPLRGKQAGSRGLCVGRTSYRTSYTLQSAEHGSLTVPVAVVRTYQRRRSGKQQVRWLLYACLRVATAAALASKAATV